jgi:hypothetical protein
LKCCPVLGEERWIFWFFVYFFILWATAAHNSMLV